MRRFSKYFVLPLIFTLLFSSAGLAWDGGPGGGGLTQDQEDVLALFQVIPGGLELIGGNNFEIQGQYESEGLDVVDGFVAFHSNGRTYQNWFINGDDPDKFQIFGNDDTAGDASLEVMHLTTASGGTLRTKVLELEDPLAPGSFGTLSFSDDQSNFDMGGYALWGVGDVRADGLGWFQEINFSGASGASPGDGVAIDGSGSNDLVFRAAAQPNASASIDTFTITTHGVMVTDLAADPSSASDGTIYYNSTQNRLKTRQSGEWKYLGDPASRIGAWLTYPFGGSGADGAGPSTTGNLDAGTLKQYSSWTIDASNTITMTAAAGMSRIAIAGDLIVNGTLTATGKGFAGATATGSGNGRTAYIRLLTSSATDAANALYTLSGFDMDLRLGGAAGSGARTGGSGTSGAGGAAIIRIGASDLVTRSGGSARSSDLAGQNAPAAADTTTRGQTGLYRARASMPISMDFFPGGPGASGGWGVHAGGSDGASTAGGNGGGVILLEVDGNVTIGASGSILARGDAGSNGGAGTNAGGGAAGGGGGGRIIIRCTGTYTNGGTVSASGGLGGTGGTGGTLAGGNGLAGEDGVVYVEVLN